MGKWLGPPHGEIRRCGAKNRQNEKCGQYAMTNGRCRFHGGLSTGARNPHRPLKHGLYTKQATLEKKALNEFLKTSNDNLKNC
jgi:hypothetical protein